MSSREERVGLYFDGYPASELVEMLVDAEDEIEVWKAKVIRLEAMLTEVLQHG